MLTDKDVRAPHRLAIDLTVRLVSTVTPADLGRPTPCRGWDLAALLIHMTAQHRGFAAAARGSGSDPAAWDTAAVADAVRADPSTAYAAAARDVVRAFNQEGVLQAPFALPEFGPGATFPGGQAIQFHFVDYVVHGWDVARAMTVPFDIPADVVHAAAPVVFAVPDGDFRAAAGSPFAPALASPADGDEFDRMLLHLGRSPDWTAE